MTFNYAKWWNR